MNHRLFSAVLAAMICLVGNSGSFAADATKVTPSKPTPTEIKANPKGLKVKLVDINSAKKEELKTLPGVSDSQAEKIIAGRPYGSKAHLITRNVVERATYDAINQLVVAKPTKQLLDKAAEMNKKKE